MTPDPYDTAADGRAAAPAGLFASVQGLMATSVELLHTRLQLLSTELEEEKTRLLRTLSWGAAAFLLMGVGLVFLAMFITVLLWEHNRLLALGLITLAFIVAGGVSLWQAMRHLHAPSGLFAASLAELRRDRAALAPRDELPARSSPVDLP